MKNSYLANQVKALRIAKGYSQDYLATQCQLNLRTIQRIESGQTEPHGDTLQRLAICLGVMVEELTCQPEALSNTIPALPKDQTYIALIHLSALSFILFPLLGAIVPFILWVIKRNQIQGIEEAGKRILNFQITWCLIVGLWYAFIISGALFHVNIPAGNLFGLGTPELIIIMIPLLYLYNVIMIIVNCVLSLKSRHIFYHPALRLLK